MNNPYARPLNEAWTDHRIRQMLGRAFTAAQIADRMVEYEAARGEFGTPVVEDEAEAAYIEHLTRIEGITTKMCHTQDRHIPGGPFGSPRRSHRFGPTAHPKPYAPPQD